MCKFNVFCIIAMMVSAGNCNWGIVMNILKALLKTLVTIILYFLQLN